MRDTPRLRGNPDQNVGPWPVGSIPDKVLIDLGRQFIHRMAIGLGDVSGDDFGTMFAVAVQGEHLARPLGLGDVVASGTAWSVKTIKKAVPKKTRDVRLISGRISPDYAFGIDNPHADPDKTGRAVLAVWNARVNESEERFDRVRVVVMVRNFPDGEFSLFEQPIQQFPIADYRWRFNKNRVLYGFDKASDDRCFTWQPTGGQFTIIRRVPGSARHFSLRKRPPAVPFEAVLSWVGYRRDWVQLG